MPFGPVCSSSYVRKWNTPVPTPMKKYVILALRIVAALILLQTLFFKFTAHPGSVALFSELGVEPAGRIGTGILELIGSILILVPRTVWIGALIIVGIMFGAILSHLTVLGIEFNGDGGSLFTMAVIAFVAAFTVLWFKRRSIPFIGTNFR